MDPSGTSDSCVSTIDLGANPMSNVLEKNSDDVELEVPFSVILSTVGPILSLWYVGYGAFTGTVPTMTILIWMNLSCSDIVSDMGPVHFFFDRSAVDPDLVYT